MESRGKHFVQLVTGEEKLHSPQKKTSAEGTTIVYNEVEKAGPKELREDNDDHSISSWDDSDNDPNYSASSSSSSSSYSCDSCSRDNESDAEIVNKGKSLGLQTVDNREADNVKNCDVNDNTAEDNNIPINEMQDDSVQCTNVEGEIEKNDQSIKRRRSAPILDKKNTRKRIRNESNWMRNKAKLLRNMGKDYTSSRNTNISAKQIKERCGEKCQFRCREISEDDRKQVFDAYYDLSDINLKRSFINHHLEKLDPKYRYPKTNTRKLNNAFFLTINGNRIRVCKQFFKATLCINDRVIGTVINKRTETGSVDDDRRGKHGHHPKVNDSVKESVRKHISSIPRVESHYLRKQTSKEFIEGSKTIAELHRDYTANCEEEKTEAATYHMYNDIFNNEFNISFFKPRKDQCNLCFKYNQSDAEEKEKIQYQYEHHQNEKCLSRVEKEDDKKRSNKNFVVACYDMEAVLQVPRGEISIFYYKSKLNIMNLTITDLANDETNCYVWHEGHGGKGSIEICTSLLLYLEKKSEECDSDDLEITLYSDNCGGQQKNRYLIGTLWYAVQKYKIKQITQKFLIVGHTQNEGDATHATIEREVKRYLKSAPIFIPEQYISLIRTAKKKGKPYQVKELSFEDFLDVKTIETRDTGTYINSKGEKVLINEMYVIKFVKNDPTKFFYKNSFGNDDFETIHLTHRGRRSSETELQFKIPDYIPTAYKTKHKLKENKLKDLKFMLDKGFINKYYSTFYNSLF